MFEGIYVGTKYLKNPSNRGIARLVQPMHSFGPLKLVKIKQELV